MNVTVNDLMTEQVLTASPTMTVGRVRDMIARNGIHSLPVLDEHGEPVGIVSSSDLVGEVPDALPMHRVMTEKVYTIPRYAGVHMAARTMRKNHIHRLVVTHEQAVVGIISSFDLLQLVEGHRFTMKNPPTSAKRNKKNGRGSDETAEAAH